MREHNEEKGKIAQNNQRSKNKILCTGKARDLLVIIGQNMTNK